MELVGWGGVLEILKYLKSGCLKLVFYLVFLQFTPTVKFLISKQKTISPNQVDILDEVPSVRITVYYELELLGIIS